MTRTQTFAVLAQRWQQWSPRTRVRVDLDRVHEYRSAPWPRGGALTVPTATYLASRDGRFQWLAFDFDTTKYGADAVATDAAIVANVLDELDVPHLLVQSGPTDGAHIWVRLDCAGADADAVDRMAHALQAHLPTLDISPLTNADTGCVRIPGSPHRHGGHAVPSVDGQALDAALTAMDQRPASAELLTWLHARFPTREHSPEPSTRRGAASSTPGLTIVGTGAGAHLARARTDLTPATRQLLTHALPAGADRSAIAWSILLGMAASGCTWHDVTTHLDQPGLTRLREDYDRHQAHAIVQWEKALDTAAATAWPRTAADRVDDATTALLDEVSAAAADGPRWARPGGASDERVLLAFHALCERAHATTINVDVRRLAEAANVHHTTASRSMARLAAEGWTHLQAASEGTAAATWTLCTPPACTAAPQVKSRPQPPTYSLPGAVRLEHAQHDVWVWRDGLGGVGERVHFYWSTGTPVEEIAALTGYSVRTVHRWMAVLGGLRLLSWRPRLETAARILGAAGVMVERARRHQWERGAFDWWHAELDWRRTPGKKRRKTGPTRASTDPAAIALPIAAPARARFGRFPTKPGGKMDWAAAIAVVATRTAAGAGVA
ncbi:hypothetical protein [Tsukamurella strandjordii]|uniref:hypothetical protein n=1 Tax=Tsukamurella strandjordii TaxID=147577 RepID=UPI0031DED9B6